jgi:hypothetical protein
MARYKTAGLRRKAKPRDLQALFVEAGRKIARNAGLLDAYRKGTGLLLRTIRTQAARDSLKAAQEHCRERFNFIGDEFAAREHANRLAMASYTSQWWVTERCDAPPDSIGEGDEWFAKQTVREIVENWRDPIPDATGELSDKWAMPKIQDSD